MSPRSSHKRYGTKELLRPSDKFLNDRYTDIMSSTTDPAGLLKQEYYKKIIELNIILNDYLPERYRDYHRMPQIRKDFVERVKNVRSKKDAARLLETFREQFMLTEDETEIGRRSSVATDELGNPINFLPIHYTSRLQNTDDLSLDVTSLMSNFSFMAENYKYMNRVIDILELGKDILDEREISETDYKGNPIKEFYNKAENLVNRFVKRPGQGNYMYQRLQDYYDMVVYGKMKVYGKTTILKAQL